MKTMRIGSSIIHLDPMYDINCEECDEGTIVRIDYPHAEKEYLVLGILADIEEVFCPKTLFNQKEEE